jgi:general secretion pathway protein N
MKDLGGVCIVGCFWLGVSAFGVLAAEMTDMLDSGVVETTGPSPWDRPAGRTEQPPSANPLWGISINQLSATRDRPVFSPTRRPPPKAVVGPVVAVASPIVQKPKEPDRPQLSLLGTIVNGDDGFAIFMDQTTKIPMPIRVGAGHQGWTLRLIKPGSVTLQKGQESAELVFPKPASGQNTAAGRVAGTSANPSAPPPRLGFTAQPAAPIPPPQSTSFRTPARPFGNPAQRQ